MQTDSASMAVCAETRNLARELLRTLKQAEYYAKRIDKAQGNPMQGEIRTLELSHHLEVMAEKVRNEFFESR